MRNPHVVLCVPLLLATPALLPAQVGAERVAVDSAGLAAVDFSEAASLSDDGRFVAFVSFDPNLAPGEANGKEDVFVRDRLLGLTERVAPGADRACRSPAISGDGRFVAFVTDSTNLVTQDLHGENQILLWDRQLASLELISSGSFGGGDQGADFPSLSDDGRYVAFQSYSTDLVAGDVNFAADIFLRDRQANTTELISVSSTGQQTSEHSYRSALTFDGRFVVFETRADNLEASPNGHRDVFRRDRQLGLTEQVSLDLFGGPTNGRSAGPLDISDDGRFVSFHSEADDLVAGQAQDPYPVPAAFVRDMQLGVSELVSVDPLSPMGAELADSFGVSMSADGRLVVFGSSGTGAVYLRDRQLATTLRVDHGAGGQAGNQIAFEAALSDDGRLVGFTSHATNLVVGDTNNSREVFVRAFPRSGELQLTGASGGATATVQATELVPNTVLLLGVSLQGPGPLPTSFGLVDLGGAPLLFVLVADAMGVASWSASLPAAFAGAPLWVQGLDLFSGQLTPAIGTFVK